MLSLLLHMHQPDYRDPETGWIGMPWVRLHSLRGYRDVPKIIRETGAKVTVNLVPSLVMQWRHYAKGGSDRHLELVEKPAEALSMVEARFIQENFFHGHPDGFRWFSGRAALRARVQSGEVLGTQALRDIQLWSVLAWFGGTALEDFPVLGELRRKGGRFSEADKKEVLIIQRRILQEVEVLYRGLPEVSTSPAFHPILPLLINTAHAKRCMPGVPDPGFSWPEDAQLQLEWGKELVEAVWGQRPVGCWPSEGSVSPEVVELLRDSGFKWFAMDEEILKKSGVVGDHLGCWETGGIRALFRDRALSDRIGFVYGSWDSEAAVADLIGRLPKRPVFVALDGENPWEGYQDGGVRFLRALLGRVATQSAAELAAEPPIGHIKRIFTGSWIQADFKIWIGDEEDRQAWGLLKEARQEVARVEAEEGESSRVRLAKSRILPAEGSDWFWWFGGEFSTPFAMEFDALFRAHLRGVYRALEKPVPEVLFQPIKKSLADIQPMGPFYGVGGWFDQAGEGSVRLSLGAMAMEFPGELRFGRLPSGECRVRMVPELEGWGLEVEPRGDFLWVRLKTPLGGYFPASGYLEVPLREQRERPI